MRLSVSHVEELASLLREAGMREIMPRFRALGAKDVRAKTGPLDLVTDADEAAEHMIAQALSHHFPSFVVIGEEAAGADPSLLEHLPDADCAFVVDPLDGTANYAAGVPVFGVMAAAFIRGEVVAGCIYDPICDEAALALRGEGAWTHSGEGRRMDLRVASPAPVGQMTGAVSWRFLPEPERRVVCGNLPRLAATFSYRCAATEYRLAAAGHCHFLFYNRLMPWDHAPGWLLHREAGGYSAHFDGSSYMPNHRSRGLICAPDQESWHALREGLLGHLP
ncbi:MAG: inositol monophosphatase [Acetobacteraceae bacterium]|nr:inositol monophosphatase [Acetobacteraceae bacterium]